MNISVEYHPVYVVTTPVGRRRYITKGWALRRLANWMEKVGLEDDDKSAETVIHLHQIARRLIVALSEFEQIVGVKGKEHRRGPGNGR